MFVSFDNVTILSQKFKFEDAQTFKNTNPRRVQYFIFKVLMKNNGVIIGGPCKSAPTRKGDLLNFKRWYYFEILNNVNVRVDSTGSKQGQNGFKLATQNN